MRSHQGVPRGSPLIGRSAWPGAGRPGGSGELPTSVLAGSKVSDAHVITRLGRVDHLPVTQIDPDVVDGGRVFAADTGWEVAESYASFAATVEGRPYRGGGIGYFAKDRYRTGRTLLAVRVSYSRDGDARLHDLDEPDLK
jgi:hypothetical protein